MRIAAAMTVLAGLALGASAPAVSQRRPALVELETTVVTPGIPFPRFAVDAAWPRMPEGLIVGQVSGVAVAPDDTIWFVHRPASLTPFETGAARQPPTALCCRPAPTVVHFAKDGRYLGGFGGDAPRPVVDGVDQWPKSPHGIFIDAGNTVWLGGNGDGDNAVLNYSADGRYLRQIGRREKAGSNTDGTTLGQPADIHFDGAHVLIADGYGNKRLARFDKDLRFVGAYGADGRPARPDLPKNQPSDPDAKDFGDIVHCVVPTGDGHLYVCDRRNNRAQLFRVAADGSLTFLRTVAPAPNSTDGTRSVTDIALSPDKRFLYVADMMNGRIWILRRQDHRVIATVGRNGRLPGQFTWLHSIATDREGDLYATEVATGQRMQKLVMTGVR